MASWQTEPRRITGEWFCFRQVSPDWPPLWHAAGEPSPSQESARWHVQGDDYAQYLSLSPQGAWSELIRYLSVRSETLAAELRRNLWLVFVREQELADLSSFENWADCGLEPAHAVGDHQHCQALGDELVNAGYRGVLSSSAALPGIVNLTLFGERYEQVLPGGLETWANPDPRVFLPCTLAAGASPPPSGLMLQTCYRRMPHAGYRLYLTRQGLPLPDGYP